METQPPPFRRADGRIPPARLEHAELLRRIRSGERISPGVLSGQFTPEEMSHFITVLNGTEDMANAGQAMADYIGIIAGREEPEEDLRALAEKYRKTKSFGG